MSKKATLDYLQKEFVVDNLKASRIIKNHQKRKADLNILGSSLGKKNKMTKTALLGAAFVAPAAYISIKHVEMYPENDTKNRAKMRNKMFGFFAGVAVSVILAHQKFKVSEHKTLKETAKIIGVLAAPFLGLGVAKQANNQFYA